MSTGPEDRVTQYPKGVTSNVSYRELCLVLFRRLDDLVVRMVEGLPLMIQRQVRHYVAFVAMLAAGQLVAVCLLYPNGDDSVISALALLGALAILAELLGFFVSPSAKGSIAFIPYFATILVVPSWIAVVVAIGIKTAVEMSRRATPIKTIFNISQHALTVGLALLVYRMLGGQSMLAFTDKGFAAATLTTGLPAVAALTASFLVNTTLVSGVIALSKGQTFKEVWRETHLASIGVDVLASPVVFVFAWVYSQHGPIAAAVLWVPILGFRQLNKVNADLDRLNRELLQLMVKSIEARDPYTSGHSRRVEHFAILIARAVGLTERDTRRVGQAALLHDVGKIHEKYAPILQKTDRLTPSEWATIQQHPADGAELVATMSQLHDLVPAIRHHHERWDGAGYPDALAGDAIPFTARIIALADTIDAMTSERPYRPAMSEDDVRREIVRGRGSQFDPAIVDRLMLDGSWKTIFAPVHERRAAYGELHLVASSAK